MKWLFTCSILTYCVGTSLAQPTAFRWREERGDKYIGLNLSASRYCGDISERYNIRHLQLGWAAEVHGRYRLDEQWCVRADIGAYYVWADQRNTTHHVANYLAFSSTNFSANAGFQWDIRPVDYNLRTIPYLFAGVGVTHLNPKTVLNGMTYSLPPFQTEGKAYPLWVGQFSYGMGLPITLNRVTQLRIEGRYTHVLSDYLDDVSDQYVSKVNAATLLEKQLEDPRIVEGLPPNRVGSMRGNPDENDGYFLFTLQLVRKFR